MKYILNFFGSLFCFIIGFILSILLFTLTMMNSTEFLVNDNIVKNLVMDIDIKHLVGEESYKEINDLLEDSGIPKEYVDYVVENEDIKEYLGDYASSAVDYVLYEKDMPKIDEKELTELLIKSFDKVVEDVNSNKINIDKKVSENDIKKVHNTINKYVPKIVKEIPEVEKIVDEELKDNESYKETREQIDELTHILDEVKKSYSYKYVLVIIIIVGFALIILIKFKSSKLVNWLWRPFVTTFVLCTLLIIEFKTLMNYFFPSQLDFLRKFIDNNVNHMCDIWKRDATIYLIIIILLIVLKIVLTIIRNKKDNETFELNEEQNTKKRKKKDKENIELPENQEDITSDEKTE